MLEGLQEKNSFPQTAKPVIIMDAGIASQDNIDWLTERGYHYLAVSREQSLKNPKDQDKAIMVRETEHSTVCVYSETDEETKETRLYCHSEQKAKKEQSIRNRFHVRMEERVTGHLFITLLAYHLVHPLRYQLKQQGIHLSWDSIRHIMSTQQRMTIILPTDHKVIHLRTTAKAEVRQKQIYDALNIKPDLIGKCKTMIDRKKSVVPTERI